MRQRKSVGEYLAFLSVKYEIEPEEFLAALRQAEMGKKEACGKFLVEYRGKIKAKKVFLVRNATGVVAQFRVPDEFLLNGENSLGKFMDTEKIRKHLSRKSQGVHSNFVRDVRSGMTHINLKAKILSVADLRRIVTKYGNYADVAKALIGDETGTIKLCLWNEQIKAISVGDTVHIRNARASVFNGETQLTIGTRGVLKRAEDLARDGIPTLPLTLKT